MRVSKGSVVVGAGVALILLLAMVDGDLLGGLLGTFASALIAGVACGALVANDDGNSRPG